MFNLFKKTSDNNDNNNQLLLGYKITNGKRNKKYGIAANNLEMFKEKIMKKFPNINNGKIYLAKDGTEIIDNDYFKTLPAQTLFVLIEANEKIQTDFEILFNKIRKMNKDLLQTGEIIKSFVTENHEEFHKFLDVLQMGQNELKTKCLLSNRNEHPEWFIGQSEVINTKEEIMIRRAQDRIRGYFYKVKDELIKSNIYRRNKLAKEVINNTINVFKHLLTGVEHFGMLFNRKYITKHKSILMELRREKADGDHTDDDDDDTDSGGITPKKKFKQSIKNALNDKDLFKSIQVSLCHENGQFTCHGLWNQQNCRYTDHQINPYLNRENAIVFQMWNFDHAIELSRSIIPSIIETITNLTEQNGKCLKHHKLGKNISILKYFLEIFTIENLKFVHIICHDKSVHSQLKSNGNIICEKCDEYEFIEHFTKSINI